MLIIIKYIGQSVCDVLFCSIVDVFIRLLFGSNKYYICSIYISHEPVTELTVARQGNHSRLNTLSTVLNIFVDNLIKRNNNL